MRNILKYSIIVVLVMLGLTAAGRAQEELTPWTTTLSDTEIDRRIDYLEELLDASKLHGQIWQWGWLTIDGVATVGLGVAAGLTDEHDDRVDYSVNAANAALGVIATQYIEPVEARFGADRIRGLPDTTRQDKLAKLRAAEDQLRRNAKRADLRWSWEQHLGNAGLALISGTIVGLWGETGAGITTGVTNLIGGIAYLLTPPARPADDWAKYKSFTRGGGHADLTRLSVQAGALRDGARVGVRYEW